MRSSSLAFAANESSGYMDTISPTRASIALCRLLLIGCPFLPLFRWTTVHRLPERVFFCVCQFGVDHMNHRVSLHLCHEGHRIETVVVDENVQHFRGANL